MVRRSFTNPLLNIRSFSTSRRWKPNSPFEKAGVRGSRVEQNVDHQSRKVSIDHTVLSGDESRLMASQDFSRSFEQLDASDSDRSDGVSSSPNFGSGSNLFAASEERDAATDNASLYMYMKPSLSEPSFLIHHPDGSGLCPCRDCTLITMANTQSQQHFGGSRSAGAPVHSPPMSMNIMSSPPQQERPASPGSDDPALQARTEAIRIQQQLLGDNHPDVIFALSSLAKLHRRRGNYAEAASFLKESQTRSMMAKSAPQLSAPSRKIFQDDPNVPTEITF